MKKLIYSTMTLMAFMFSINAQVGIEMGTETVSPKAIMDFPDDADGGILLPYVEDINSAGTESGTLLYNAQDGRIYYYDNDSAGNKWVPMTPELEDATDIVSHDTTTFGELNSDGVLVSDKGNNTANPAVSGVLVLESDSRALALPKVESVDFLESPKAGMICYDVSRKALAIFNGEYWILRN